MRSLRVTHALLLVAAMAATAMVPQPVAGASSVEVHLLAFNDFHGNLDPPSGSNGRIGSVAAGGVEYLATHLARLKALHPASLVVSAGDNIGASPLLSGLFHDEPAIEALNAAGLDVSSVGNHEFDEGWVELRRMQRGSCHPVDGCQDQTPFMGARFQYLAANARLDGTKVDAATRRAAGLPSGTGPLQLLPEYVVKTIAGLKVGFIGLTLQGTQEMVVADRLRPVTFDPEAATVDRLVPILERLGVHTIVVLIHQGGAQANDADVDGCQDFSGAIAGVAAAMPAAVEVIVSGHTHRAYNCLLGGKLVTSAASFGRVITDITLQIDRKTDRIVSKSAHNVIVTRDVPKAAAETAILDHYRPFYAGPALRVIGSLARDIARQTNRAGESALGDLIADAQLEAARRLAGGDVAVAFMNSGGIRADLVTKNGTGPSAITYEEAFAVQPFENRLMVKTMTGDAIRRLLERQFTGTPAADSILQVSASLTYRYDMQRQEGARVDPATILINGRPLEAGALYRVAMNEFLATGGSGFSLFAEATNTVNCGTDIDALVAYITSHSPIGPGPENRIVRVN